MATVVAQHFAEPLPVQSTSATPVEVLRIPVPPDTQVVVRDMVVQAQNRSGAENVWARVVRILVLNNVAGIITAQVNDGTTFDPLTLGYSLAFAQSGNDYVVTAIGAAGHTVDWYGSGYKTLINTNVFLPSDITGLLLWFRADLGVSSSGGRVTSWANMGNTSLLAAVTQGNAALRPSTGALINGQAAFDFVAANGEYLQGTFSAPITQPGHEFIEVEPDVPGTMYMTEGVPALPRQHLYFQPAGNPIEASAGAAIGGGAYANGEKMQIDIEWNGATSNLRKNGAVIAGPGNVGADGLGGITIGGSSAGTFTLDGQIAEVIYYDHVLSAGEYAQVRNYFLARYQN